MTPPVGYTEMKDSGIEWVGMIPSHWRCERLQWYLQEINESNDLVQTSQILSLTNKLGVIPYEEKGNQGNKSKEDLSQYKIAYPDCIVANSMNILIGSVGLSHYYGCVSPVYYVFKAKDNANIQYFNYLFSLTGFQQELRRYANGILEIRLRVSAANILKRHVMIPPLPEQSAIAAYLNTQCAKIDDIIAEAKASIEEYKQWKASVIYEAVTKGLDPDAGMKTCELDGIVAIPAHWETKAIKYLATCNDETLTENTAPDYAFDYIDIGSVKYGEGILQFQPMLFSESPSRARRIVKESDVIISTVRTYLKAVAIIRSFNQPQIVSTGFAVLRPYDINPQFLYYAVMSDNFVDKVEANSVGISYPAINASEIMSFKIPVPPVDEQSKIIHFLEEKCVKIDELIAEKQTLIADLEAYKKSLIYEAVTGKRKVY